MAAAVIHTDDTPIAVLAPGNGKTRTERIWIIRRRLYERSIVTALLA
jgi:hypothetical protein